MQIYILGVAGIVGDRDLRDSDFIEFDRIRRTDIEERKGQPFLRTVYCNDRHSGATRCTTRA